MTTVCPEMFRGKTVPCCACFQVTTTTRTIKEVTYLGPDGQPIDYLPSHMPPMLHYDHNDYQNQVSSRNLNPGFWQSLISAFWQSLQSLTISFSAVRNFSLSVVFYLSFLAVLYLSLLVVPYLSFLAVPKFSFSPVPNLSLLVVPYLSFLAFPNFSFFGSNLSFLVVPYHTFLVVPNLSLLAIAYLSFLKTLIWLTTLSVHTLMHTLIKQKFLRNFSPRNARIFSRI